MFEIIRKFKARLGDSNFMVLWFEILLFSALYGVAFRSWLVFGGIFLGASWLLNRPRGVMYTIYAMSLLWGFIAFSVGHSMSWGWAVALGVMFFLIGVRVHFNGLKNLKASKVVLVNHDKIEWRRNCYDGLQNLN